jgi:hypothetical protein
MVKASPSLLWRIVLVFCPWKNGNGMHPETADGQQRRGEKSVSIAIRFCD